MEDSCCKKVRVAVIAAGPRVRENFQRRNFRPSKLTPWVSTCVWRTEVYCEGKNWVHGNLGTVCSDWPLSSMPSRSDSTDSEWSWNRSASVRLRAPLNALIPYFRLLPRGFYHFADTGSAPSVTLLIYTVRVSLPSRFSHLFVGGPPSASFIFTESSSKSEKQFLARAD